MFGGADALIVGSIPNALAQQQQAGLIRIGQQRLDLFEPGRHVLRLLLIQLPPLPAHRTGNTQQHQQLLAQPANRPGALAAEAAFEPGMLALGINGDNAPEYLQQALASLCFTTQGGTGGL
ncbi:hypothetical protein D3C84_881100 [compost metagenome]